MLIFDGRAQGTNLGIRTGGDGAILALGVLQGAFGFGEAVAQARHFGRVGSVGGVRRFRLQACDDIALYTDAGTQSFGLGAERDLGFVLLLLGFVAVARGAGG